MDNVYAIRPEEKQAYQEFCGKAFGRFRKPAPGRLWYYTTADTFAQIIESKKIWATQISCLNDHSEFRYSVRLLREAMKGYTDQGFDADTRWLAEHVYTLLADDGADASWFFVLCMSEKKDDLSQWRAYGGGEGGVAIALRPQELRPRTQNFGGLAAVSYDEAKQQELVKDIAAATVELFKSGLASRPGAVREKWAEAFLIEWREAVIWFAPILKHPAFEKEEEWRLLCPFGPGDLTEIRIKQRQSLISRHLPLSFGDKLPICEVMVGPCRHPGVSRVSVDTFLQAKGYELNGEGESDLMKVTVSSSRAPFQTT